MPFDPFIALLAAVDRQTTAGLPPEGWLPSEKLSLPDALAAYGHGADIVVLDRDILAGGPSSIIGTTVGLTVIGGQVVHRSEALP